MSITHLDENGQSRMVDVSAKQVSKRIAKAQGRVIFPPQVYQQIQSSHGRTAKGSIVEVAKIAGIMAAKNTANLIPMCHPMMIEKCDLEFSYDDHTCSLYITAEVAITHKTGVEMEALTAVSVAALTVYDMTKALSHDICISDISLVHKSGGKRDFDREEKIETSDNVTENTASSSDKQTNSLSLKTGIQARREFVNQSLISVEVKYFGQLQEVAKKEKEYLEIIDGISARQLFEELNQRYSFPIDPKQLLVAVNHSFSSWDTVLKHNDIVALIPPVAGG
ncbi:cyclic pyranopterin monophosphate synthase MoaC [Basilea psittacipulmonis]|uniref:cyclic pyranopterin monophosphate synthase MoaC n=1 Tax=Basilea psittacipulmonis TaxID=1472345 RepID=UPI0009DE7B3D|nr:cyclic pyranopterin monophosphate synthase MoaC [Basilea psittacipulmonis]